MSAARARLLLAGALIPVGAALAALAWTAWTARAPVADLPVIASVPDFTLTERSGRSVSLADLRGSVWVADFIFTSCGGPCPRLSRRMAQVQQSHVSRWPERLRLVSVTVDPRNDSPEKLRAYAERYAADPERWWFLTGEAAAVQRLVREGFLLATEVPRAEEPGEILHSTRLALVDPQGRIRGYYDGLEDQDAARLSRDLESLLRTSS